MVRVKSCIATTIIVLGLSAGPLYHDAYAANGELKADTAIVLAQNSDSKPGLFNRIFNSSKDKNRAKPLFLNKNSSSAGVRPYDFSNNRRNIDDRRQRSAMNVDWDSFVEDREKKKAENRAYAMKAVESLMKQSNAELEMQRQASAAGTGDYDDGGQQQKQQNKKMVYDPAKAWSYNPNKSQQQKQPAKIYNSNR